MNKLYGRVSLSEAITQFINSVSPNPENNWIGNEWVGNSQGQIYVRKAHHLYNSAILPTLDLATFSIGEKYQSSGVVTAMLDVIEEKHSDINIRVENIQTERFKDFFDKRGYIIIGDRVGEYCAWRIGDTA